VAVAEEAVLGRGRRAGLPVVEIVARAAVHDDAPDFLVEGEAGGGSRAVRSAGDDDLLPLEGFAVLGQEGLPLALRVFLGEVLHELEGALLHAVGQGDLDRLARVDAGGGLEADVTEMMGVVRGLGVEFAEPAVGVTDLNIVETVAVQEFRLGLVEAHQPDDELAARRDARVDRGDLDVGGLAAFIEDEVDLRVRQAALVDLAGARPKLIDLRLRVVEFQRGFGREAGDETEEKAGEGGAHGVTP